MNICRSSMGPAALILALATLALPGALMAQGTVIDDTGRAGRLLAVLDHAAWLADGEASDRHIYVIASTDCGYCARLFADSRSHRDGVQLRWLLVGTRAGGAGALLAVDDAETLGQVYAGASPPATDDLGYALLDVNAWLPGLLELDLTVTPTFVFQGRSGLRVVPGLGDGLAGLLPQVQARRGGSATESRSRIVLADGPAAVAPAPMTRLINFRENPLPLFTLPDQRALAAGELAPRQSYAVTGLVGDDWIQVAALQRTEAAGGIVPGYLYAPDEVRLARLDYRIEPAAGELAASDAPRPVLTHPDPTAPVITWLAPGEVLPRTGRVQREEGRWTAVALFRDGTPAFVPEAAAEDVPDADPSAGD
ncbi:MAG: hypothetical protein KF823_11950 [Xanthomonadales bacterium]|nr:hypothetical protein [Xanthomonadales bacterium]